MKVAAYFILGMPGETPEDIEQTIAYGKRLAKAGVDEAGFALLIPLPGTPIWDQVVRKGEQPDYLDLLIVGDLNKAKSYSAFLTAEQLSDYRRQAYFSFFLARAMYHPISMAKTIFNVIRGGRRRRSQRPTSVPSSDASVPPRKRPWRLTDPISPTPASARYRCCCKQRKAMRSPILG